MNDWTNYGGPPFDFGGTELERCWARLHAGNLEPFPGESRVQDTWRAYHEGRFGEAVQTGAAHGGLSLVPAAFAATIHAHYLEPDEERKVALFEQAMAIAERAVQECPGNANAHYMQAVSIGRYSQFINMVEALARGLGPKVRDAAQRCLELEPRHAEGHVTIAGWHAEIVDKAGVMLGGLSFGAKRDLAEEHFDRALELAPESPVPCVEKAAGLLLMYGESSREEAQQLLRRAVAMAPADAMQALDIEKARQTLADLPNQRF